MAERSVPSSAPKLSLTKGGQHGEEEACKCCTPLACCFSLRASPLPEVHCSYFGDQSLKIPVAKKHKFTWHLSTLEPRTRLAAVLQDGLCQDTMPFSPRRTRTLLPACPALLPPHSFPPVLLSSWADVKQGTGLPAPDI